MRSVSTIRTGLNGDGWNPWKHPTAGRSLRTGLVTVAVLVLGILGIVVVNKAWVGENITECGVDAQGPYANVRINSLWGGLGNVSHHQVHVNFTYDGAWYDAEISTIEMPVLDSTTTVVHGKYPPRSINLRWDGGPKGEGRIHVEGQTVYRTGEPIGDRDENWPGRLVTKAFAAEHLNRGIDEEIVPDDLQRIGCSIYSDP